MTIRRALACLLSAAVVLLSPGVGSYKALAAVSVAASRAVRVVSVPAAMPSGLSAQGGAVFTLSRPISSSLGTSLQGVRLRLRGDNSIEAAASPPSLAPTPNASVEAAAEIKRAAAKFSLGVFLSIQGNAARPEAGIRGAAPSFLKRGNKTIRLRFAELRAAFGKKRAENLPSGERGAWLAAFGPLGFHTPEGDFSGRRREPPRPEGEKASGRALGLSLAAAAFIGSYIAMQAGVFAFRTAMPIVIQQAAGSFQAIAQLSLLFAIAMILGRQAAPWSIRRFGLKGAFIGTNLIRAGLIAGLGFALAGGAATVPLILALHTAYAFFYGISISASESIASALVGREQSRLERYWTWLTTSNQIVGILVPVATGAAVAGFGFVPAIFALPAAILVGLAVAFFALKPSHNAELGRPAENPGERVSFWRRFGHGARLVLGTPALRSAFFANALIMIWTPLFFFMLSPAYGLLVGGGSAEIATAVSGWMTGFYGLGGLLGGLFLMRQQRRHKRLSDSARRAALRRSLLRWVLFGGAALGALATMLLPLPSLGAVVALPAGLAWLGPMTAAAIAIIPFGMSQSVAALKLRSFFQSRVPSQEEMPDATSFYGSAAMAFGTVVLYGISLVFESFAGFTPFKLIALSLIPIFAAILLVRWRLARSF